MTKQEEIRNGLIDILDGLETPYTDEDDRPRGHVDAILEYLKSKNAVIKVDRELPKIPVGLLKKDFINGIDCLEIQQGVLNAGYTAVEPLI